MNGDLEEDSDTWLRNQLLGMRGLSATHMQMAAQRVVSEAKQRGLRGLTKASVLSEARKINLRHAEGLHRPENDWRRHLVRDDDEREVFCHENLVLYLLNHAEWNGVFAYDEFSEKKMLMLPVPGTKESMSKSKWTPKLLEDHHVTATIRWFNRASFPNASKVVVADAIDEAFRMRRYHPVRDFLTDLKWDGTKRVYRLFERYFGAQGGALIEEFSIRFMVSAVARIMVPGAKVDTMPVLEGRQGTKKSSGIAALFGDEYFDDNLPPVNSKDASQHIAGLWAVEMSELATLGRAEAEDVKAFLSRRKDRYRPPYGREVIERPRQTVFIGSTNDTHYLSDLTGNRRYWPIPCEREIDIDAIRTDRDQLWAEAKHLFDKRTKWWIEDSKLEAEATAKQASRTAEDPWEEDVRKFAEKCDEVFINDILDHFEIPAERRSAAQTRRVGAILRRIGFAKGDAVWSGSRRGASPWSRTGQKKLDI